MSDLFFFWQLLAAGTGLAIGVAMFWVGIRKGLRQREQYKEWVPDTSPTTLGAVYRLRGDIVAKDQQPILIEIDIRGGEQPKVRVSREDGPHGEG